MERFLLDTTEYQKFYNCNTYSVDAIAVEKRQNVVLGSVFILIGIVEMILYIPCTFAIWRHLENSCYKFMFVMALLDIPGIFISAILTGIFGVMGTVYCSTPNVMYIVGTSAFAIWVCESSVEILLALNRCIEVGIPGLSELLFEGWRTWLWMVPPTIYAIYVFISEKMVLFTGLYFAWFFNPHIGYVNHFTAEEQSFYQSKLFSVHNWIVCTVLPGMYTIFAVIFAYSTGTLKLNKCLCFWNPFNILNGISGTSTNYNIPLETRVESMKIFAQVIIIGGIHVIGATIYVYMQYYEISELLIITAQLAWTQAHGIPPVIYLALNRTLRADCAKMLKKAMISMHCYFLANWLFPPNNLTNQRSNFKVTMTVVEHRSTRISPQHF